MTFVYETTEFVDRGTTIGLSKVFLFPWRIFVRVTATGVDDDQLIGVVRTIVCGQLSATASGCGVRDAYLVNKRGLFIPQQTPITNIGGYFLQLYAMNKPGYNQVQFDVYYESTP